MNYESVLAAIVDVEKNFESNHRYHSRHRTLAVSAADGDECSVSVVEKTIPSMMMSSVRGNNEAQAAQAAQVERSSSSRPPWPRLVDFHLLYKILIFGGRFLFFLSFAHACPQMSVFLTED